MKTRILLPEKMDDPHLDAFEHQKALQGLQRINRICRTGTYLAHAIQQIADKNRLDSLEILDLGCGSGDVMRSIASKIGKHRKIQMQGWDKSSTAIEYAQRQAATCQQRDSLRFLQVDVWDPPEVQFDIVYCSLFLHHFEDRLALQVIRQMVKRARHAVLVDDLVRSRSGLLLAKLGCYLFSRSAIVHFDGPQSVRAAFTSHELLALARKAGLKNPSVHHHWPSRMLLSGG